MPDAMEARSDAGDGAVRADDMVQTLVDVTVDGRVLPAESVGRVAYADRGSGWHSVTFDVPFPCSALLAAGSVRRFAGTPNHAVPDPLHLHQGGPVPPYPYQELEVIRTLVDVVEEGQVVPAGSQGTIVDVSRVPGRYEVEFADPFPCVATMTAAQIAY